MDNDVSMPLRREAPRPPCCGASPAENSARLRVASSATSSCNFGMSFGPVPPSGRSAEGSTNG
eukprot:CAMPEP_0115552670 /NCGR_PEP_ID=MMETSP0271-20121206/96359_1 /TAXON_ID=71861 /ORGANISM="Scrippsiella trochoidea, Strain CCMP3099" /LENGTH=62 /DNA_ID=CAMNT_0002986295 /DNA_START=72 /DNA_END=256 /DNA_ORIENTATION=-